MENRVDLIGEFLENSFNVKIDFISLVFNKLEEYLDEYEFTFDSDNIEEQWLSDDVLRGFLNWYSKLNDNALRIVSTDECCEIINFMFETNI